MSKRTLTAAQRATTPAENAATFAKMKEIYRGHPAEIRKLRRRILEGRSMRLGTCDRCPERATVETTLLRAGKLTSKHYCLECAAKSGIAVHDWALQAARRDRLARRRSKAAARAVRKSKARPKPERKPKPGRKSIAKPKLGRRNGPGDRPD